MVVRHRGKSKKSSPTVVNGTVYIGLGATNLYALSATDGSKQWSFAANADLKAPTVVDDTVYVGSKDNNVYALDAADGSGPVPVRMA